MCPRFDSWRHHSSFHYEPREDSGPSGVFLFSLHYLHCGLPKNGYLGRAKCIDMQYGDGGTESKKVVHYLKNLVHFLKIVNEIFL